MDALSHVIGEKIKLLRKARGLSQSELGFRIGGDAPVISRYERGQNTPSVETIFKLSQALNAPIHELLPIFYDPVREKMTLLKNEALHQITKIDQLDQMEHVYEAMQKALEYQPKPHTASARQRKENQGDV